LKTTNFIQSLSKHIATLGFIGYFPYAPGTFGTLFALFIYIALKPPLQVHFFIIITGIFAGIYASSHAEKALNEKDSKKIVIDEFMGFFVAVFYLPQKFGFIIAAFLLFRFFDIIKPFPISKLERTLSKGFGIVADDILAGIYTNVLIQLWIIIFRK
jgi:phosphatidylglycerophosphatase A